LATLFDSARAVIEDLDQIKADPETGDDALDINPQLPSELAQLSQIAKAELNCEHFFIVRGDRSIFS
jgi:ubiquitin carboxyl-terminal hydrolase 25/28